VPPQGATLELDDAEWRASFDILVGGPIRLLRDLVPQMSSGSAILFVLSASARQPFPGPASYVLQPGVAALADVLSRELAPEIRVNSFTPDGDADPAAAGRFAAFLLSPAAATTGRAFAAGGSVTATP
jgi:3-oxoacyl-[acyl-carrier protein] reductase